MIRILVSYSFTTTATKFSCGILKNPCDAVLYKRISSAKIRFFSHDVIKNSNNDNPMIDHHQLSSSRAQKAVQLLPTYLSDARRITKYHPIDSPNGALQLSVAENVMLEDLLVPWLRALSSPSSSFLTSNSSHASFNADQIYYQPTHGRLGLRSVMADYLIRLLHLNTNQHQLDIDGLVIGAGCNAVLENLCFCLTEPGDAVLVPTPYYAAFDFDLGARIGLTLIPVVSKSLDATTLNMNYGSTRKNQSTEESNNKCKSTFICPSQYYPTRQSLDSAYNDALSLGHPPKVLLLSHPNNPLGICYPPSVVKECIEWVRERHIHLISDEIYAGSVYRQSSSSYVDKDSTQNNGSFQSILQLAATHESSISKKTGFGLGPYIHFVYALSKDFALSGLRVGVAYSENENIRLPMQKLNDLCQVSSQTQCTVEHMLNAKSLIPQLNHECDTTHATKVSWSTDLFLEEGRKRIRERCDRLQQCLLENEIPYIPADSGMFVWMDLSEFLPKLTAMDFDKMERQLYLELLENGLLFTPGRSMRNEFPGFFRCVFTAATDQGFDLALERIAKFVQSRR